MSLSNTTVSSSVNSGETNTFGNITPQPENFLHQTQSISTPLVNGTGAGQANHAVELLINCNGGVTLDLTATGANTGLDGKNRDFSNGGSGGNVKDILIENMDAAVTITMTQPGANGWTGLTGAATGLNDPIGPGGHRHMYEPAGKAVSATNKLLTFTGNALLKITIVGVAA